MAYAALVNQSRFIKSSSKSDWHSSKNDWHSSKNDWHVFKKWLAFSKHDWHFQKADWHFSKNGRHFSKKGCHSSICDQLLSSRIFTYPAAGAFFSKFGVFSVSEVQKSRIFSQIVILEDLDLLTMGNQKPICDIVGICLNESFWILDLRSVMKKQRISKR